jgi:hypothetical protein
MNFQLWPPLQEHVSENPLFKKLYFAKVLKVAELTFYSVNHFLNKKPAQVEMPLLHVFLNFARWLKISASGISLRFYVKKCTGVFHCLHPVNLVADIEGGT